MPSSQPACAEWRMPTLVTAQSAALPPRRACLHQPGGHWQKFRGGVGGGWNHQDYRDLVLIPNSVHDQHAVRSHAGVAPLRLVGTSGRHNAWAEWRSERNQTSPDPATHHGRSGCRRVHEVSRVLHWRIEIYATTGSPCTVLRQFLNRLSWCRSWASIGC